MKAYIVLVVLMALAAGCLEEPREENVPTVYPLPVQPSPVVGPDNTTLIMPNTTPDMPLPVEIEEDLFKNDLDKAIGELEAVR